MSGFQIRDYRAPQENVEDLIRGAEELMGKLSVTDRNVLKNNKVNASTTLGQWVYERTPDKIKGYVIDMLKLKYISPYTTILLPTAPVNVVGSITWVETRFTPSPLETADTFAPGRYDNVESITRHVRTVQARGGLMLDYDFYKTEQGRALYYMQLDHLICNAQLRNEYTVMEALLKCYYRYDTAINQNNGTRLNPFYGHDIDMPLEARMKMERNMFAIVNKSEDKRGLEVAVTNIRHQMGKNGVRPDAMIVPPNMINHHFVKNDDLQYNMYAGSDANRRTATEIPVESPLRLRKFDDELSIVDTHVYRRDSDDAAASSTTLLTVPKQVGECYPMALNMIFNEDLQAFDSYHATYRNIKIYDEDSDAFEEIQFVEALKNCFRFEDDGSLNQTYHNRNVTNDMFMYQDARNHHVPCQFWHQVRPGFLSDNTIDKVVRTMKAYIFKKHPELIPLEIILDNELRRLRAGGAGGAGNAATLASFVSTLNPVFDQFFPENDPLVADKFTAYWTEETTYLANPAQHQNRINTVLHQGLVAYNAFGTVLMRAFMHSKINSKNLISMHRHNIVVPIDFWLVRPWMNYSMSSMIIMKAGDETGKFLMGDPNFIYSVQTEPRKIVGSLAYHSAAAILKNVNVVVAPHVLCQSYLSGTTVDFVSWDELQHIRHNGGMSYEGKNGSVMAMAVPIMEKPLKNSWMDFRGYNQQFPNAQYHASMQYYKNLFGIADERVAPVADAPIDFVDCTFKFNTICWLGAFKYGKDFKEEIQSKGHLGKAYNGVATTRQVNKFASGTNF